MDDRGRAWFNGWVVTRKGGPTSGNWRHDGVKGQHGGSAPGGGHDAYSGMIGTAPPLTDDYREMEELPRDLLMMAPVDMDKVFFSDLSWEENELWRAKDAEWIGGEIGQDKYDVAQVGNQWASTSNDEDMRSLSLQEAASEEFDVPLSDYQEKEIATIRLSGEGGVVSQPLFERSQEREMLRGMYDLTQRMFEQNGFPEKIKLFRGVQPQDISKFKAGDAVKMQQNAMGSWSVSWNVAEDFANPKFGSSRHRPGVVLMMEVPTKAIVAMARTGLGTISEGEYVVMGIPGAEARVTDVFRTD